MSMCLCLSSLFDLKKACIYCLLKRKLDKDSPRGDHFDWVPPFLESPLCTRPKRLRSFGIPVPVSRQYNFSTPLQKEVPKATPLALSTESEKVPSIFLFVFWMHHRSKVRLSIGSRAKVCLYVLSAAHFCMMKFNCFEKSSQAWE